MRSIEFYIIIVAIHFDINICVGRNNSNLWSSIKVREAQFKKKKQQQSFGFKATYRKYAKLMIY